MSIESDLCSLLKTSSALVAVVGARLFADTMLENGVFPALVYKEITSGLEIAHGGATGLRPFTYQFDAYATTRADAVAARDAINALMKSLAPVTVGATAFQGANFRQQMTNYERETRLFRAIVEWEINIQT